MLQGEPRERTIRRRNCAATFDYGIRASARAFVGLAAQRRRRRQRRSRRIRSRISTSAASATTTSTAASIKRYREYDSMPGFGIDEISGAELRARAGGVEPAAGRLRIGRHAGASTSTGCGPRSSPSALWTDPGEPRRDASNYQSVGAQVDLRFSVLHWYDMTLSVGYAVGFQRRARARRRVHDLAEDNVTRAVTHVADVLLHVRRRLVAGARLPGRAAVPRQLQARDAARRASRSSRGRRRGRRLLLRQRLRCSASLGVDFTTFARYVGAGHRGARARRSSSSR